MTTGSRARPTGGRRGSAGSFNRRRRGRNVLKAEEIDYKDVQLMRRFVNERGKIVSGQRIGVTAKNQRRLARAIKRAQHLALIPLAPNHTYVTGSVQTETQRPQETDAEGDEPQAETNAQAPEASDQQAETQQAETVPQTDDAPTNGAVEQDTAEDSGDDE